MTDVQSLRTPLHVDSFANYDNADRPITVCSGDRSCSMMYPFEILQ